MKTTTFKSKIIGLHSHLSTNLKHISPNGDAYLANVTPTTNILHQKNYNNYVK